ncbi:hypothetical protein V1294_006066 [Bradyrhizobium sp. AZCC 1678]|uniref:hypothetical protein n=1 Tax=Bradyrhizobium sp. AZCC 1678 TaxID=3117030 RepID=UPI002FF03F89
MLAVLKNARRDERPWPEIAFALLELERIAAVDENGRPWIQRAEVESGYAANQLRRMTKASLFRDHLIQFEPALAEKLLSRPFSHIETISRIWRLDESEARSLIEGRYPNATFRDLYAAYERVSKSSHGIAPIMAGKKAAKEFRDKAISLFKNDQSLLFGGEITFDVEIVRPIVPFRYANPDCYVVCRENNKVTRIEAMDSFALYDGTHTEVALRKMIATATESTFFSRFWIVVPAGESATVVLSECDHLGLLNVGVILMIDGALKWQRVPSIKVKPSPDRRDRWSEYALSRLRRRQTVAEGENAGDE